MQYASRNQGLWLWSQAYVHSRLRGRVDQLVKGAPRLSHEAVPHSRLTLLFSCVCRRTVLNRARPEIVEATKAKSSSSRRHGSGAGAGAGAGAGTR